MEVVSYMDVSNFDCNDATMGFGAALANAAALKLLLELYCTQCY
jgi:hypothetical protein